ncbi:hypothetical protein QQ056_06000 [Oscillatoria laete-virens NRMC-F 0139]|nr:hypothetical protein [Oscillatoria laete-virens]MDL5053102.1 hypothetical protein [Oscillatoria laete-virens NRMC-F 0139]
MTALALVLCGLAFVAYVRFNFREIANQWMRDQKIKAEVDFKKIHFGGIRSVTFEDVRVYPKGREEEPVIIVGNLRFRYTLWSLLSRRLELVSIEEPRFRLTREVDQIIDITGHTAHGGESSPVSRTGKPWRIDLMRVSGGQIQLDNLGDAIPPIVFEFETKIENMHLGDQDPSEEPLAKAELRHLKIYSPWDVFTPVLEFPSIVIHYKISNLLRKRLDALEFFNPIIYIGEDLFWLVDYAKKAGEQDAGGQKEQIPWVIGSFRVLDGQIGLQYFGRVQFMLPLKFQTYSPNITVGSFENLQLETSFEFEKSSFYYPEYDLSIEDVEGSLEFALPPNTDANNIVQVVKVREFQWKDFTAENLWVSVTFDQKGIYLLYGGDSYGGYLNGNGNLLLQDKLPWDASLAVTQIDTAKLTKAVAMDRFYMTGKADLKMAIMSEGKFVNSVKGGLDLGNSGVMNIPPLESFFPKIEEQPWDQIRKDLAEILLKSFSEYHYTKGVLNFDYTPQGGKVGLIMDGDGGKRNISIILKDDVFNQEARK